MSLDEAAMTEAAIVSRCGGPGFAIRIASMEGASHMAVVRSTGPGRRGAVLHALLVLDDSSGHHADWIVGDVLGIGTFGDVVRRWDRSEGRVQIEPVPDTIADDPGSALATAVLRRLPWLSGLDTASGAQPAAYAVADLARIGDIIQRCPKTSIELRLRDFDRLLEAANRGLEAETEEVVGISSVMTASPQGRSERSARPRPPGSDPAAVGFMEWEGVDDAERPRRRP